MNSNSSSNKPLVQPQMKFLYMKYLSYTPVWEWVVHQDTVAVAAVAVVLWPSLGDQA